MVEESRDKARKILVRCIEKDRIDTKANLTDAEKDKEQQKKWFKVVASFAYPDELFKYLNTASLDRFYS